MIVIGLMSGTSYDGIDAAAADLRLDGDVLELTPLGSVSAAYDDELRAAIAGALPPAATDLETVCRLDTLIGQAFGALAVRADEELCGGDAELVGSHGQTLFHWVRDDRVAGTLQLGQPAWIAEATGLPVVADFRPRDVAAGGQGAPLVSVLDLLWLAGRPGRPVALNLGGIANVTVPGDAGTGPGGPPVAFDTGPANALLDLAASRVTGGRLGHDVDGRLAAAGRVRDDLLDRLLDHPYFVRPAPKSTGKELFHAGYLDAALAGLPAVDDPDLLATLTAFTTVTVADAVHRHGATEVIASGGGVRNPELVRQLRARLGTVPLRTSDELGLGAQDKEAYAFAVLAFLTAHGLPGTVPSCTGARHASVLGSLTPGRPGAPALLVPAAREGSRAGEPPVAPRSLRLRAAG
ncbi:anhydro-N-acetylmuramic acid kinase [Friedmanniella endophytica]|uniref:Anhydro-N-acetylmuramic acid kinase n=1 Tax=Microlunatus kandeliicorticis TaxID=1759536 RepID=A0A7W3IT88_9ACTN|nr:anhydro-N-acetylmuramic acid kinase [Microlunatus kandeliicorticis]MBA8794831.1 anhydro-N-acetylmuramic acid kinase [Microlunatus kandeliicorticis]